MSRAVVIVEVVAVVLVSPLGASGFVAIDLVHRGKWSALQRWCECC